MESIEMIAQDLMTRPFRRARGRTSECTMTSRHGNGTEKEITKRKEIEDDGLNAYYAVASCFYASAWIRSGSSRVFFVFLNKAEAADQHHTGGAGLVDSTT